MAAVEMSKEMLELLECPVCFETMYPPIYQCPNGHAICAKCKVTVNNNNCPTCRGKLGQNRCLLLEKLLATMSLHCQYQTKGCNEMVRYDSKAQHEDSCMFRPYNCPFVNYITCDVKGDIPSLVTHMRYVHGSTFKNTHRVDTVFDVRNPMGLYERINFDQQTIYEYMGDHFCLHFEELERDNHYGVVLRFMGEDVEARNYQYSLEIGNDRRRMIWLGVPKSIRETMEQIKESGELMIIHETVARKFAESKGLLTLSLRVRGLIWKEDVSGVPESPCDFSRRASSTTRSELSSCVHSIQDSSFIFKSLNP